MWATSYFLVPLGITQIKTPSRGINPRRRYNNYKYICTQHRSTSIYKANIDRHKISDNNNGDYNTPLSSMDRSSGQKSITYHRP